MEILAEKSRRKGIKLLKKRNKNSVSTELHFNTPVFKERWLNHLIVED